MKTLSLRLCFLLAALPTLAAAPAPTSAPTPVPATVPTEAPAAAPTLSADRAVFRTDAGDFVVGFYETAAPSSVAQIKSLINAGAYTGAAFSYIQTGYLAQFDLGAGAPVAPLLKAEFRKDLPIRRGSVVLARDQDKEDSASSSLFIAFVDLPDLTGKYTVVGEVTDGQSILAALEKTPVDDAQRPLTNLAVTGASLLTANQRFTLALATDRRGLPDNGADAGAPNGRPDILPLLAASLLAIFALGVLAYFLSKRNPNAGKSCAIVSALVATPALLAYFAPKAAGHNLAACALLFGLIGVVWLLGRFETAVATT